jgi:hypothetical protein
MKMDAMQKRKIWIGAIVAITHFIVTVFAIWWATKYNPFQFFEGQVIFLQPTVWIFVKFQGIFLSRWTQFSDVFFILLYISIPLWSICFGWLYVKFTSWLNHFPVLGKKVF